MLPTLFSLSLSLSQFFRTCASVGIIPVPENRKGGRDVEQRVPTV